MPALFVIGISSTKSVNYSAGVTGSSNGCSCHGAPVGTVILQGLDSTSVIANTVYPIVLTYNQGLSSNRWGLNIKCSAGTFTVEPGMRLSGNNEITHSTPLVSSPSGSYTFSGIKWNSGNLTPGTSVNFTFATTGGNNYATSRPSAGSFTIIVGSPSVQCTSGNTTYSTTNTQLCSSQLPYQWNGLTCATAGSYINTLSGANSQGCDSIAALNLIVNATSTSSISVCESSLPYIWNGLTFIAAGIQTVHLTSKAGCDSAATLNLKVNRLPVVKPIIGPASICLGSGACFADSTIGGYWTISNVSVATLSFSGCMTTMQPGNVQLWYNLTDSNGCSNTAQKWVSIIGSQIMANAYTTTPVLYVNDTIKLFNFSTIYGASYYWTGPNGFTSVLQNPVITSASMQSSGYYKVVVTNNTPGCSSVTTDSVNVKVNGIFNITGKVISPKYDPVKDVDLLLYGPFALYFTTDSIGEFGVTNIRSGNYTITPSKNNDINKANGVTAVDIALTQAHILGKNFLNSPYKIIAADVNGDGKVTALDIVYMKRLVLGIDTTFNNSVTNEKRLWAFVDSSYNFPDTTIPFPFKDSISYISLNTNQANQTFIGIKLGDLNWDWNPALAKMPSPVFIRPKRLNVGQ